FSRFKQLIDAQKDTFFRLKNNEHYNWRKLSYLFAKRFKQLTDRDVDQATSWQECSKDLHSIGGSKQ
ncbi:MAG TPA: hypothetical protein VGD14_04600, partial [bacterium]